MLTLIRHAESIYNYKLAKGQVLQGLEDCGLTKNGIKQAKSLTGSYDIVFLSPMKRCVETWQHSKIKTNCVITCPLLREYKQDICDFFIGEPQIKETESELLNRIENIKQYLSRYKNNKCCVITHGDLIFYMTAKKIKIEDIDEWFGQHLSNAESIEIEL
jgi:broad specificity phosphatase PhoE